MPSPSHLRPAAVWAHLLPTRPRFSRRMILAAGGFWATTVLGRRQLAIAQDHPLWNSEVSIYTQGGWRYIVANGIPDHPTGTFPNAGNPNRIRPQTYRFQVAAQPQLAPQITLNRLGAFGVAINGVVFEPGAGEFWQGDRNWQYEALSGQINLGLDANNAHVQPSGAYHYHGLPLGLLAHGGAGQQLWLLGYAADGFPIYGPYGYSDPMDAASGLRRIRPGYQLKSGQRPTGPGGVYDGTFWQDYEFVGTGDLDECNGRFGVTPEYPNGIYHYYITETFPFISRYFRGTPSASFQPSPAGRPAGRPPAGRPPSPRFPRPL
ncbi:YHYH protein [Almyronema epifaneia]|uniref:YHYH protein n=1 Tax=Almyronema epifaneia S1 TaxID=2991925 RepID=A0ABW6IDG9_9CYAN